MENSTAKPQPSKNSDGTPLKVSEILDRAADVIERNGWYQGGFIDVTLNRPLHESRCCVMGALSIAESGSPYNGIGAADEALMDRLGLFVADDEDDCQYPLADWNDADGRTAEEVVRELRAAAASEREAGR